jgi:preprotein translocase subunit SecE
MNSTVETQKYRFDRVWWGLVLVLIAAGVAGNYYFSNQSVLIKAVGLIILTAGIVFIAFQTEKGKAFWNLWKESVQEVRRMVWPTRQETIQTTLAVLGMVVVMGILLWTADFILLRSVAWLTGHWGA